MISDAIEHLAVVPEMRITADSCRTLREYLLAAEGLESAARAGGMTEALTGALVRYGKARAEAFK